MNNSYRCNDCNKELNKAKDHCLVCAMLISERNLEKGDKKNIIVYTRTDEDNIEELKRQEKRCLGLVNYEKNKLNHLHTIRDNKVSGQIELWHRKGGKRIIDICNNDKIEVDGVIIENVDVLVKGHPDKFMRLLDDFQKANMKVIVLNSLDITKIPKSFHKWFMSYWEHEHSNKIKKGLEIAIQKGKTLGRPKSR